MARTKQPQNHDEALAKAVAICCTSETSEKDIRIKMAHWGMPTEIVENIIRHLKNERYIDDSRYANAFVHDKFYLSKWGKQKIAYNLRLKNIDSHVIADAIAQIGDEEYIDTLRNLIAEKAKGKNLANYTQKASLMRFAAGRGFEEGLIYSVMESLQ